VVKRFGTVMFSCVVLGVLAATTGCAAASARPLETVQAAVREAPSGLDEVRVDEGKDGLSRYVLLVLITSGDELPADALAETLQAVGEVLPDEYDSVRVAARASSGERLDIAEAVEASGVDGAFMINARMADIPADAVRSFAGAR